MAEVAAAWTRSAPTGDRPLALLHCVSSYPGRPEDANLAAIATMRDAFGVPAGWSDHTLGIELAVAAVALGAAMVEKHLTLDRRRHGPDHAVSLEPDEFAAMVAASGARRGRARQRREAARRGRARHRPSSRARACTGHATLPAGARSASRISRPCDRAPASPGAPGSLVGRRTGRGGRRELVGPTTSKVDGRDAVRTDDRGPHDRASGLGDPPLDLRSPSAAHPTSVSACSPAACTCRPLTARRRRSVADGFEPDVRLAGSADATDEPARRPSRPAHGARRRRRRLRATRPTRCSSSGDRFETAAAALAATVARVPIVHLHGGEQTLGAFDDALRHAITKLATSTSSATRSTPRVIGDGRGPGDRPRRRGARPRRRGPRPTCPTGLPSPRPRRRPSTRRSSS